MRNLHDIQQRPASHWRLVEPSLAETRGNPARFAEQYLGGFLTPQRDTATHRFYAGQTRVADPMVAIPRAWDRITAEMVEGVTLHPALQTLPMSEATLRNWDLTIHALQVQHIQPERADLMLSCSRAQWRAIMARFRFEEFARLFGAPGTPPRYRGIPVYVSDT